MAEDRPVVSDADRICHIDCKDTRMRVGNGRNGRLSSHLPWGDPRRGWDFVSAGRGDVPWEDCFRALSAIGYQGPISVEWEDAGMDRLHGAPESLTYLRVAAHLEQLQRLRLETLGCVDDATAASTADSTR
jgi:sugar phosphate isomerase/epimerase